MKEGEERKEKKEVKRCRTCSEHRWTLAMPRPGTTRLQCLVLLREVVALVPSVLCSAALSTCCFESRDVSALLPFLKAGSQSISQHF